MTHAMNNITTLEQLTEHVETTKKYGITIFQCHSNTPIHIYDWESDSSTFSPRWYIRPEDFGKWLKEHPGRYIFYKPRKRDLDSPQIIDDTIMRQSAINTINAMLDKYMAPNWERRLANN